MRSVLKIIVGVILTSLCMFPISLRIFPVNSKLIMAVIGALILGYNAYKYKASVTKTFFGLTIWACILSLVCLFSVVYNNSVDYSYVPYVVTMWVWLSAGYLICYALKQMYGYADIELVSKMIIYTCVFQCISALIIDSVPAIRNFIITHWSFADYAIHVGRMFGFGACFDPAGIRFACALVLLANMILKSNIARKPTYGYWISFGVIVIVGCIISRTTLVGVGMFFLYFILYIFTHNDLNWKQEVYNFLLITIVACIVCIYYYQINPTFEKNIRFAFELFFNYFEQGRFGTHSTDILFLMYDYTPESLKTWIIGDGYLLSPTNIDPYYVGDAPDTEYYMGTDVGYYRLIFYFGIIGLFAFICFLLYAMKEGVRRYSTNRMVFIFIFMINMVCWFKVGTDVFTLYGILLNADDE